MPEDKKNIFEKAVDALSSRDEKAELEATQEQIAALQQQLAEAQKAAQEAQAAAAKAQAEARNASAQTQTEAQKAIQEANQRAAAAEAQARQLKAQMDRAQAREEAAERLEALKEAHAAAAPKFIAEHVMQADESLSHLALKYYGHATPPYWKLIYEANKAAIGDNPNRVKVGLKLNIPELPDDLKK